MNAFIYIYIMSRVSKDTKEKILDCAKDLIKKDDIDFSMRNIAKICNITQGTIYIHFKNKNELLAYIMIDDWHKSLKKMDDLVNNCDSFSKGLVGLAKIIREFSKPYKKVWASYKDNLSYTTIKDERHKELIGEIKEYIDLLIKRFTKENLNISNILAETVLGSASSDVSLKELENLGKVIIKEK